MNKLMYDAEKIMVLRRNYLNTSISTQGGVLSLGFAPVRLQRNQNLRRKKNPYRYR